MAISEIPEVAARFDPPSETTCFCINCLGRPELFKHVVLTFPCIFVHVFYLVFFGNVMLASEFRKEKNQMAKSATFRACRSEEGPPGTNRGRDLQTSGSQCSTKILSSEISIPKVASERSL